MDRARVTSTNAIIGGTFCSRRPVTHEARTLLYEWSATTPRHHSGRSNRRSTNEPRRHFDASRRNASRGDRRGARAAEHTRVPRGRPGGRGGGGRAHGLGDGPPVLAALARSN